MTMTNTSMQVEPQIRDFIAKNLLYSTEGFTYADDASLIQEGIIDSLGVVELVEFVQSTFGVKVDQQEVVPANFDSVVKLATFIRGKLAAKPAAS
jgi:acyl carrier protein